MEIWCDDLTHGLPDLRQAFGIVIAHVVNASANRVIAHPFRWKGLQQFRCLGIGGVQPDDAVENVKVDPLG